MKHAVILFFLFLCCFIHTRAQQDEKEKVIIQFTGVILTSDSLRPVPFANILIKNTYRGTTADFNGYFSIIARPGEEILFSAVGFKKVHFHIPDTITHDRYSLIQLMSNDTIMLAETVIYPWPTRENKYNIWMDKYFTLKNKYKDPVEIALIDQLYSNLSPDCFKDSISRQALKVVGETWATMVKEKYNWDDKKIFYIGHTWMTQDEYDGARISLNSGNYSMYWNRPNTGGINQKPQSKIKDCECYYDIYCVESGFDCNKSLDCKITDEGCGIFSTSRCTGLCSK